MNISKIIAGAVVASLVFSGTAVAGPYDYQPRPSYHSYERSYERHNYDRGYSRRERRKMDETVTAAVAGLIIGGLIVNSVQEQPKPVVIQQTPDIYVNGRRFSYDQNCNCYRIR